MDSKKENSTLNDEEFKERLKLARENASKRRQEIETLKQEKRWEKQANYQRKRYAELKKKRTKDKNGILSNDTPLPSPRTPIQGQSKPDIRGNESHVGDQAKANQSLEPKHKKTVRLLGINNKHRGTEKQASKTAIKKKKSKPSEKALEDKRLKARERQRKRRAKLSAEDLDKKREYDRKYKEKRRSEGTWKLRKDMSEREKRKCRKLDRERKRRQREQQKQKNVTNENEPPFDNIRQGDSGSKKFGRKRIFLNRSKVYRDLKKVEAKLQISERRAERYKKRLHRLKQKENVGSPSPSKKILALAKGRYVASPVKRRLTYLENVHKGLEEAREKIVNSKNKKELQNFNKIVASPRLRKKKIINQAKNLISHKSYRGAQRPALIPGRKLKRDTVFKVKSFYCQDVNSKMLPGKKDCITRRGIKKQKRLLLGTLKNLHAKYNKANPSHKVSYDVFRRLRPFYIVFPKTSDRNTCACIICTNLQLIQQRLMQAKVIELSLEELIKKSVCNQKNKKCMYSTCQRCLGVDESMFNLDEKKENEPISLEQWEHINKTIKTQGNYEKNIRVVEKKQWSGSTKDAVNKCLALLRHYKAHTHNITYQYNVVTQVKESLKQNECLIHIDFSENYICKMNEEIQSYHFGGSKVQLSLHTVVVYTQNNIKSLCTVCSDTDHRAHAVWAHLKPVFEEIQSCFPDVNTVHILSDGPSSQYKNRYNLYFITTIEEIFPKIRNLTWNFSVAGHGKGAADGVGGTVKRTADAAVNNGRDISDVVTFINMTQSLLSKVKLIEVKPEDIQKFKEARPLHPTTVQSISSILQVTWAKSSGSTLFTRTLSCFSCQYNEVCEHNPHRAGFVVVKDTTGAQEQHFTHNKDTQQDNDKPNQQDDDEHTLKGNEDVEEGHWIVAIYDDDWYPGVVERRDEHFLSVNFMNKSGNRLYWPDKPDIQTVEADHILCRVDSNPHPISNRHFAFEEGVVNQINAQFKKYFQ